jgi:hypothetical protein
MASGARAVPATGEAGRQAGARGQNQLLMTRPVIGEQHRQVQLRRRLQGILSRKQWSWLSTKFGHRIYRIYYSTVQKKNRHCFAYEFWLWTVRQEPVIGGQCIRNVQYLQCTRNLRVVMYTNIYRYYSITISLVLYSKQICTGIKSDDTCT